MLPMFVLSTIATLFLAFIGHITNKILKVNGSVLKMEEVNNLYVVHEFMTRKEIGKNVSIEEAKEIISKRHDGRDISKCLEVDEGVYIRCGNKGYKLTTNSQN